MTLSFKPTSVMRYYSFVNIKNILENNNPQSYRLLNEFCDKFNTIKFKTLLSEDNCLCLSNRKKACKILKSEDYLEIKIKLIGDWSFVEAKSFCDAFIEFTSGETSMYVTI